MFYFATLKYEKVPDKYTNMTKKDKIKWFFVVVNLLDKTVEVCQTKEDAAKMAGVHPNTVKLEKDIWRRFFINRITKEPAHFIIAKKSITPNKRMERDYKNQLNTKR